MESIAKELTAFMQEMENPVAVDNGDGTSSIDSDSSSSVDNLPTESIEDFISQSYYGDKIEHGVMRHKRKFEVKDNILHIN